MAIVDQLNDQSADALRQHAVQVATPNEEMLELKAVLVGEGYTKPRTNLLLRRMPGLDRWEIFVDDDFHYTGDDDRRRRLFCGDRMNQWLALTPPEPVEGDVNRALLCALEWLDSPIRNAIAVRSPPKRPVAALDPQLARFGQLLLRGDLERLAIRPTVAQAEAIRRIAETGMRALLPACVVVCGPAGCGKTAVVATAGLALLDHSHIREVLRLSGAAIVSGAVFPQQRDERLRQVLELCHARRGALVVLEQFDLVARYSETAACLIAEYVDRGTKLVGVARSEFAPKELDQCDLLARRVEPVVLAVPDPAEQREIVLERLRSHPLAGRVEVAPEVVPAALLLARLRAGAGPGAALSLLDAALARAAWSGSPHLLPDDLYDLVPEEPEEE